MIAPRRSAPLLLLSLLLLLPAAPAGRAAPAAAGDAAAEAEAERVREEDDVLRRARAYENALVRVVRKIRPVTVSIENWRVPRPGMEPVRASGGSGVLISSKGHLLTNQHVIAGAAKLVVVFSDGERADAEVVGADERGDIALLKVSSGRVKYVDPERARIDRLAEGAWVLACGNPFFTAAEGEPIVTLGIVSGLGRVTAGEFMYGNSIQHDAEINPGNSGGPLFDINGNLLGINGRIASSGATSIGAPSNSGVGYTIPMDQVRNFFEPMLEGKRKTKHGDELIGLEVATALDADGVECGVEVKKIEGGSPAGGRRGLEVGDVIWQIVVHDRGSDYHKIFNRTQYVNVLSPLAAGSRITIHYVRDGRKRSLRRIDLGSDR